MSQFKCKQCGYCCNNILPLSKFEIKKLKKLAVNENKLLICKDWYNICPFLNYNKKCDIYEDRPLICREYDCYKFENSKFSEKMLNSMKKEKYKPVDIRKEIFGGK